MAQTSTTGPANGFATESRNKAAQLIDVVELADFHDVLFILEAAGHAAGFHDKAGGVGDDGLLEANLGSIGKAGNHGGILAPLISKAFLRGGIAIGVLQSFD